MWKWIMKFASKQFLAHMQNQLIEILNAIENSCLETIYCT